jgi:hypothetical protein
VIAKEPNTRNHEQASDHSFVTEWESKNGTYPFALRIGEWAYGLLNGFPLFDSLTQEKKLESLRRIAFMNVKKMGGGGLAISEDIYKVVCEHRKYILDEIAIIDPDIILLGLSFDDRLKRELFGPRTWQLSGYTVKLLPFGKAWIIDFYHPSSRNVGAAAYSLLQNVVQSDAFKVLAKNPATSEATP